MLGIVDMLSMGACPCLLPSGKQCKLLVVGPFAKLAFFTAFLVQAYLILIEWQRQAELGSPELSRPACSGSRVHRCEHQSC